MIGRILVGTDGSDSAGAAVAVAARLAKDLGAELFVAHVVPARAEGPDLRIREERAPAREIGKGILADAARRYSEVGVHTALREGNAAGELLEAADEYRVDLIVVGNRGMHGARRFFGSVPNNISHHATCSVLVADTTSGSRGGLMYKRIVIATDGSPTAGVAAQTGASLAAAVGAEAILLSVGEPAIVGPVLAEAAESLASTGASLVTRAVAGDPAEAICEVAEREGADLVVVGNKGMTGSKRFLMGSIPNHVSHNAPCDVLIVRTT